MTARVHVHEDNETIEIDGIVMGDAVAAELLANLPMDERPARLADLIEIGARVVARESVRGEVDLVRLELERIQQEMITRVSALLAANDGANPLAAFKDGVLEAMRQMAGQITTVMQGHAEHVSALGTQVEGLRVERLSEAELEAERERGSAKGRPFEELVAAELDQIAGACGDGCEAVGDFSSPGGRAGDVVVEIGGTQGPSLGTIAFEAKTGRLSRPEAMRQLDAAIEARNADFAVLVVAASDRTPAATRTLREYGGNKMVCVLDSESSAPLLQLEAAYSLARARVLLRRDGGGTLDGASVATAIERVSQALDEVRRVKLALTGAQSSIDTARQALEGMISQVRLHLEALQELVASAPAD